MGCGCLFALLAVLSPRVALVLVWLFTPLVQSIRGCMAVAAAGLAVPAVHHVDVRPGRWGARTDDLLGLGTVLFGLVMDTRSLL